MISAANLKHRTIAGFQWNLLNQSVSQFLALVMEIVLARLLSPKEFGWIAMIMVLTGFAEAIKDFGLGSALIRKKDLKQSDLSSVFWLNTILGSSITLVIIFSASYIAKFYGVPELEILAIWLSFNFLLSALNLVQLSILIRNMDFKRQFKIRASATLLSGIVAITLAFLGYGVWSLVANILLQTLLATILLWTTSPWRPQFLISRESLRDLIGFSLPLFSMSSINYWTRNLDKLLIGKYIGEQTLGFYSRAYSFMLLPVKNISQVIGQVLFPAFSAIQDDPVRIKSIYLQVTRTVAFITFPVMCGLSVAAEPFVLILLGPKWVGTIPFLKILSLLGINQSIMSFNPKIFLARGATGLLFKVGIFSKSITILAIIFGLRWGAEGVAVSYAVASLSIMFPLLYVMGTLINLSLKEILTNLGPTFLASAATAILVFFIDYNGMKNWIPWLRLAAQVACGTTIYFIFVSMFKIPARAEIAAQIKSAINRRKVNT